MADATAPQEAPTEPLPPQDPTASLSQELGVADNQPSDDNVPDDGSSDLDDIEKQMETRKWIFTGQFDVNRKGTVTPQDFEGMYEQKPLSYFAFLEFTGLLAKKIDEAMAGPDGLTIKEVFEQTEGAMPFVVDGRNVQTVLEEKDFKGIDSFVQGLFKIASYVPDLIEECQFIWLRVPRSDRAFLREIWGRSPEDGGMTNDEGEEMLTVFISQNYEELEVFFVERLPRILKTGQAARKRTQKIRAALPAGSQRSKPWSRTPELTPSQ